MRWAAIDIGTNTTLMLVAERGPDGELRAVEDRMEITRLGRGVDRTKRLDDAAVAETLAALERHVARARALGVVKIAAVATSAARDATNGGEFRARAAEILGAELAIASGDREASLTFAGALGGLGLMRGARVAVIDVGGGSTEVVVGVVGDDVLSFSHSYDVGSVRLTERCVKHDPPSDDELAAIEHAVAEQLTGTPPPRSPLDALVAIAGTATTYAAIDLRLSDYAAAPPHGHRLSQASLRAHVEALAATPLASRRGTIGLEPGRADVIVAGGVVLATMAAALSGADLVISDRGVRWGLALEMAGAGR